MNHDNDWLERTGIVNVKNDISQQAERMSIPIIRRHTPTIIASEIQRDIPSVNYQMTYNPYYMDGDVYSRYDYIEGNQRTRIVFDEEYNEYRQEVIPSFNDREEFERITTEIRHRIERIYLDRHNINDIKAYLTFVTDDGMIDKYSICMDYMSDHYCFIINKGELRFEFRILRRI